MATRRPRTTDHRTADHFFDDKNQPECFSQIIGAAYSRAFEARAAFLEAEGKTHEASEARSLAMFHNGFRRLVR